MNEKASASTLALDWRRTEMPKAILARDDDPQRPMPDLIVERDLQLSRLAQGVGPILYVSRHFHYGGNGVGRTWETASEQDRRDCARLAEEAVMAASEFRSGDAERQASLWLQRALYDALDHAYRLDEDHSAKHLIRAALHRLVEIVLRLQPAHQVIGLYRDALRLPEVKTENVVPFQVGEEVSRG